MAIVLNGASGVSVSSAQQVSSVAAEAASPSLQVSSGVAEVATYFSNQYNSGEGVLTPPAVHTSSTEASAGEPTMAGLSDFNRPVGSTSSSTHFEHLGDSGVDLQLDHIVDESIHEALKDPAWHAAVMAEYKALLDNGTWEVV
ncbi:hypothetical protein V6N13_041348 [Hibiscus sabdariffa]